MITVELASRILTQLGFYQEPSKELGVDDRRDNIVHLIEEYTHPVKEQELLAEIEALKAEVKQWEEWKESLNGWSKK